MSGRPFWQIDAFADGPGSGNPAGVLLLEEWPEDARLQAIASELNLPATAFAVAASDAGEHAIRWFSPAAEIALCGHGTLAAAHALIGDDAIVRFATRTAGIVTVTRTEAGYALSLPALEAAPCDLPASSAALGGAPIATLWHPRGYAIVAYQDEAAVRALTPDFVALAALGDIQHSATAPGTATDIVSRIFTRHGEDAVTGSAHALLAPYWAARLGRRELSALQASARGGRLSCRLDDDRVVLAGACVTVTEGWFPL